MKILFRKLSDYVDIATVDGGKDKYCGYSRCPDGTEGEPLFFWNNGRGVCEFWELLLNRAIPVLGEGVCFWQGGTMWTILTRCRDADMVGPVCNVLSDDKPLTDSIRGMRVHAAVHSEPEITDEDLAEIDELATAREECCEDECCC